MSSGQHFQPGVPLAGSLSLTASDIDTSQSGIIFANGRTLFVIQNDAPTELANGPDALKLIWGSPSTLNSKPTILLNKYDSGSSTWVPIPAVLRDRADIPNGSIPVSALYATLLQVGMVPVVTNVLGNAVVQWQLFVPQNIPAGNITPGTSNQFLVTNNGGTGSIWANFVDVLSALGAVIPLAALAASGATVGQVATWNGSTWMPGSAYSPPVPLIIDAPWVTAANWIEVYSTIQNATVRKTRANFTNTLIADFTAGSLALDTLFIGWPTSNPGAANTFTLQNFLDVLSPLIVANAINQGTLIYPRKFYSGRYQFVGISPWGLGPLTAGALHGLGAAPINIGARVERTASNNFVSTADIPVGSLFNLVDVSFKTDIVFGANTFGSFTVRADSTKIYVYTQGSNPDGLIELAGGVRVQSLIPIGDSDFCMQLYAYL